MLFRVKPATTPLLSFETGIVAGVVFREWQMLMAPEPFVFTGLMEPRASGLHPQGQAFDLRTRGMFDAGSGGGAGCHHPKVLAFVEHLRTLLRPHGVDVVLHPENDPPGQEKPPHIHVEYDPKMHQGRYLWLWEGQDEPPISHA